MEMFQLIEQEFERIRLNEDFTDYQKSVLYANLMSRLESDYCINAWTGDFMDMGDNFDYNKAVPALYEKISKARKFE